MTEINTAREELHKLQLQKNELRATEATIKSQLEGEYPIFANNLSGGNTAGGSAQIAAMQSKIDELLVTYTESYPRSSNCALKSKRCRTSQ